MSNSIPFHPSTSRITERLAKQLPHAIILHGKTGVGLYEFATQYIKHDIAHETTPTDAKGEYDPSGSISVDTMRELYEATRGKKTKPQLYVIRHADTMTIAAQNALLKLLEEPTQHTHFVLLTSRYETLLTTIRSRAQAFYIPPCTTQQTTAYVSGFSGLTTEEQRQIAFAAQGKPLRIRTLATTPKARKEYIQYIKDARKYLNGTPYQKTVVALSYAKKRDQAIALIETSLTLLTFSLSKKTDIATVKKARLLTDIHTNLQKNCQVRLQVMKGVVY